MNIRDFISEALSRPADCIAYHVSRELAAAFPESGIVEGSDWDFDLSAFVRDRRCEVVGETATHAQTSVAWDQSRKQPRYDVENGWFNVLWDGQLLDVLFITWNDDGCRTRHYWIVGETKRVAEGLFRAVCEWSVEVRGEVLVFSRGGWSKDDRLLEAIAGATFDNLVLPGALASEIASDCARFLASRGLYERNGIPWKRGVLLIGPPGNGKTHAVKALVNQLRVPCLYVRSFKAPYETEHDCIRAVFERARANAPCLVVLEDLDSLVDGKSRAVFLNELDGFAANTGVVVVATTNHPERLDPAILDRPSRFDRKYYFPLPGPDERRRFLAAWNGSLEADMRLAEAGVEAAVAATEGFSFAYLKELLLSAAMEWIHDPVRGRMDDLLARRAASLLEQMRTEPQEEAGEDDDE